MTVLVSELLYNISRFRKCLVSVLLDNLHEKASHYWFSGHSCYYCWIIIPVRKCQLGNR